MADGKKSFILYCDLLHTVELLDDTLAGKLMKHLLRYVNDLEPKTEDMLLKIAFEPIKHQLKRDLKDWESTREKRVSAGHKGGVKSGKSRRSKQKEANASKTKQTKQTKQRQANEAVNVTVNVNDTVNGTVKKNTNPKGKLDPKGG